MTSHFRDAGHDFICLPLAAAASAGCPLAHRARMTSFIDLLYALQVLIHSTFVLVYNERLLICIQTTDRSNLRMFLLTNYKLLPTSFNWYSCV